MQAHIGQPGLTFECISLFRTIPGMKCGWRKSKNKPAANANPFYLHHRFCRSCGVIWTNCSDVTCTVLGDKFHFVDIAHNLLWWPLVRYHCDGGHCKMRSKCYMCTLLQYEPTFLERSSDLSSGWLKVIAIPGILCGRHLLGLTPGFYEPEGDINKPLLCVFMCLCNACDCRILLPQRP